jgi:mannan endo-1,4-beta-mannosidase
MLLKVLVQLLFSVTLAKQVPIQFKAIHHNQTMDDFVKVNGLQFTKNSHQLFIYSANYWQAMNMGVNDSTGDRHQLLQDLDKLKSMGVNNLRIMCASEGPDDQPFRMTPSLQSAPGVYNDKVFEGLDFAVAEMGKRGFTVTMCMGNYWHWSGGFAQYVSWVTGEPIPYPASWDPELGGYTNGSFNGFTDFASRFYRDTSVSDKAQLLFRSHIKAVVTRRNVYTGLKYSDDPHILSWELANEVCGSNLAAVSYRILGSDYSGVY